MNTFIAFLVALCVFGATCQETLDFQSVPNPGSQCSYTNRGAGSGPADTFTVDHNVTVSHVEMYLYAPNGGNVKFVISSGSSILYVTSPVAVAASNNGAWVASPQINFQLQANQQYDIGGIGDSNTFYCYDTTPDVNNGFNTQDDNANYQNYANPTYAGMAGAVIGLRIYSGAASPSAFCAGTNQNNWNYGQGYYCASNSAFIQCYQSGSDVVGYQFACPQGTSCSCASGVECSNGGTQSPCQ